MAKPDIAALAAPTRYDRATAVICLVGLGAAIGSSQFVAALPWALAALGYSRLAALRSRNPGDTP